jgi:hypothetical protein
MLFRVHVVFMGFTIIENIEIRVIESRIDANNIIILRLNSYKQEYNLDL